MAEHKTIKFCITDFKDFRSLILKLKDKNNDIYKEFSSKTRSLLQEYDINSQPSQELQTALCDDLNNLEDRVNLEKKYPNEIIAGKLVDDICQRMYELLPTVYQEKDQIIDSQEKDKAMPLKRFLKIFAYELSPLLALAQDIKSLQDVDHPLQQFQKLEFFAKWLGWELRSPNRLLTSDDIKIIIPLYRLKGTKLGLKRLIHYFLPELQAKDIEIEEYLYFFYLEGYDKSSTISKNDLQHENQSKKRHEARRIFDPQLANTVKVILKNIILGESAKKILEQVFSLFLPAHAKVVVQNIMPVLERHLPPAPKSQHQWTLSWNLSDKIVWNPRTIGVLQTQTASYLEKVLFSPKVSCELHQGYSLAQTIPLSLSSIGCTTSLCRQDSIQATFKPTVKAEGKSSWKYFYLYRSKTGKINALADADRTVHPCFYKP